MANYISKMPNIITPLEYRFWYWELGAVEQISKNVNVALELNNEQSGRVLMCMLENA